jgi:hypothetical protein
MTASPRSHEFVYLHTDIPVGITINESRNALAAQWRRTARRSRQTHSMSTAVAHALRARPTIARVRAPDRPPSIPVTTGTAQTTR